MEPTEFGTLVRLIRNVEVALGDGVKRRTPVEEANVEVARKSIVAARPIRAGEVLTEASLDVKRPGGGLSPMAWDEVIGRTATRDYSVDEMIEL